MCCTFQYLWMDRYMFLHVHGSYRASIDASKTINLFRSAVIGNAVFVTNLKHMISICGRITSWLCRSCTVCTLCLCASLCTWYVCLCAWNIPRTKVCACVFVCISVYMVCVFVCTKYCSYKGVHMCACVHLYVHGMCVCVHAISLAKVGGQVYHYYTSISGSRLGRDTARQWHSPKVWHSAS